MEDINIVFDFSTNSNVSIPRFRCFIYFITERRILFLDYETVCLKSVDQFKKSSWDCKNRYIFINTKIH